jgi:hypothetical protein
MGRDFFRKFMPHPQWVQKRPALRRMEHVLHQPALWHLNRHSASRGIACGVFWSFIPIPCVTLIACLCAIRIRANLALALLVSWLTWFVLFPVYYLSYRVGLLILRQAPQKDFFDHFGVSFHWFWAHRSPLLPFFVGSIPVAAVMGAASYFAVQWTWKWMVIRKYRRRSRRMVASRQDAFFSQSAASRLSANVLQATKAD